MTDLAEWLEARGLAKYLDVLERHEVDLSVLPDLTEADLEKIGIREFFDDVVSASMAGAAKPARPIFDAAVKAGGATAEQTLHVGDHPLYDVHGARLAGLQTVSKQANFEAIQRTAASQVAFGLLENMRVNGDAIGIYLAAPTLGNGSLGAEPAPNCSAGNECNSAQKAAHDLWFWEQILDGKLETNAGVGTQIVRRSAND